MKLTKAQYLAKDLMRQHGLWSWSFKFDRAKARCGCCHYRKKLITLSRFYVQLNNEDEVRDTILHEIAHALVPGAGHGRGWREKARSIGCTAMRCAGGEVQMPAAKWNGICKSHGVVATRNRLTEHVRGASCHRCCPRYNAEFKLTWKRAR